MVKTIKTLIIITLLLFGLTVQAFAAYINITELNKYTYADIGSISGQQRLDTDLFYFIADNYSNQYPYYLVSNKIYSGNTAYISIYLFSSDAVLTNYRTVNAGGQMQYEHYIKATDIRLFELNMYYTSTGDYLKENTSIIEQLKQSGNMIRTYKDTGDQYACYSNLKWNGSPLNNYFSWYNSYIDWHAETGSGGMNAGDKEFLQSLINTITIQNTQISNNTQEIVNQLLNTITNLNNIYNSTENLNTTVMNTAQEIIQSTYNNIVNPDFEGSLVYQLNESFQSGVKDGVSKSKDGYKIRDMSGNYIPINPTSGEYILPIGSDGKPVIPKDATGGSIIPLKSDGTPMNSRDIGQTDILKQSMTNLRKYNEANDSKLKDSFDDLGTYMSSNFLNTGLLAALGYINLNFLKIWNNLGIWITPILVMPLMLGVVFMALGVGVKARRRGY